MDVVAADKQLTMQVRTLSGSDTGHEFSVAATLVSIEGAILTLRSAGCFEFQPVGTLVEIITPARYYLGEITSRQGDTATIVAEHELERSAVDAIQAAWGGGPASAGSIPGSGDSNSPGDSGA